jgi:hypothetical protein
MKNDLEKKAKSEENFYLHEPQIMENCVMQIYEFDNL